MFQTASLTSPNNSVHLVSSLFHRQTVVDMILCEWFYIPQDDEIGKCTGVAVMKAAGHSTACIKPMGFGN